MATPNLLLANWVKDAYSMELGLATVLERQTGELSHDSSFEKGLERHLEQTRQHAHLLRDCLRRMDVDASGIQPSPPVFNRYSQTDGGGVDPVLRTELFDYVTENFEIASYRAIGALARKLGDRETVEICERILEDESTMVKAIDQLLPELKTGSGTGVAASQDNIRLARATFEALNAHDLERWYGMASDDFCGEAPGTTGSMDRQKNRAYLQNYISAFPDLHFEVTRTVAQGDQVVLDWTGTGTHSGTMHTPDGRSIAPTHRKVVEYGSTTFDCRGGKVHKSWTYFDISAMMEQLGIGAKV